MNKSKFTSNNNKGLLWNLLYEGGIFSNIPENKLEKVKEIFENKLYITSHLPDKSLMEMNKIAMTEIINDLKILNYTNNTNNIDNVNNKIYQSKNQNKKDREKEFNNKLTELQDDFSNLTNRLIPKEIDFSDNDKNNDKPLKSNEIDFLLSETIKKRENELNIVLETQNKEEGNNWINKSNTNTNIKEPKLLLGEEVKERVNIEEIKLPNNSKKETKVRFNMNNEIIDNNNKEFNNKKTYGEDLTNNFINLLKKNENNETKKNMVEKTEFREELNEMRNDIKDIKFLLRSLSLNIERLIN